MSNMSYCRFQNTYNDLRDCLAAMREAPHYLDTLGESERNAAANIASLLSSYNNVYSAAVELTAEARAYAELLDYSAAVALAAEARAYAELLDEAGEVLLDV